MPNSDAEMEHRYEVNQDNDTGPTINMGQIDERAQSLQDSGMDAVPAWLQALNEAADQLEDVES